jgi:hypothetical protein
MKRALISLMLSVSVYAQAATPPSVILSWTAPTGVTGTVTTGIYRKTGTCPASGPITPTPAVLAAGIAGTTYTDTTVVVGQTYAYMANSTAVVSGVTTVGTTFSNCTQALVGPSTPTLSAVPSPGSVALTITDGVNPAGTTYSILVATGLCSGTPAFSTVASGLTALTYTLSTGITNGPYCVGVTATSGGLTSTAGTIQVNVPPAAPTGLGNTVIP